MVGSPWVIPTLLGRTQRCLRYALWSCCWPTGSWATQKPARRGLSASSRTTPSTSRSRARVSPIRGTRSCRTGRSSRRPRSLAISRRYFPVFKSKDGGASWEWLSDITDQVNGWGFPAQPALAELTEPLGGFDAGTILASGNSWSGNGTRIDLYASTDGAKSWKFVSHIAEGGAPNTTNGATPVWEPYLM